LALRPTNLYGHVVAFDVTGFVQPFKKARKDSLVTLGRTGADKTNKGHRRLLPARRERPCYRAAEQRDELSALHCPMPPVLPTERIAHLGTADCCIHSPGRNEMIAITPPIISSKEVAPKTGHPISPPGPPHRQKSFLQISGDGAWMKI